MRRTRARVAKPWTNGDYKKGQVELRYQPDTRWPTRPAELDEVVAQGAVVHLERMSDCGFSLIIETDRECVYFWIGSKNNRAHVAVSETERGRR